MSKRYTATVTREGKWWMVRIPELDGLTQARRLGEAEQSAREYIAAHLDIPEADVDVHVTTTTVDGVDILGTLHKISTDRYDASMLERRASEQAVHLAKRLAASDIPLRDIGTIMSVSHQRVAQLLHS